MSSSKIELKGVTMEIYEKDDSIYPKTPYVFSLHYNHKYNRIFLVPIKTGMKCYNRVLVTATMLQAIVDKESVSGMLSEDESYYVLSKYDIKMLTHNKKRVTCTMVDKERFRDEMLKINYKKVIGVEE